MSRPTKKLNSGRPKTSRKPDVVSLLVSSFQNGLNVTQACLQSGISREGFYNSLQTDPQFADKIAYARQSPTIQAKANIIKAINGGDLKLSQWWLERYAAEEFPKQGTESDVQQDVEPLPMTEDTVEQAREQIMALKSFIELYEFKQEIQSYAGKSVDEARAIRQQHEAVA